MNALKEMTKISLCFSLSGEYCGGFKRPISLLQMPPPPPPYMLLSICLEKLFHQSAFIRNRELCIIVVTGSTSVGTIQARAPKLNGYLHVTGCQLNTQRTHCVKMIEIPNNPVHSDKSQRQASRRC